MNYFYQNCPSGFLSQKSDLNTFISYCNVMRSNVVGDINFYPRRSSGRLKRITFALIPCLQINSAKLYDKTDTYRSAKNVFARQFNEPNVQVSLEKKINGDVPHERENFFKNLGVYEEKRKKLAEQRRQEYKEYLKEQSHLASFNHRKIKSNANDLSRSSQGQYHSYGEILEMNKAREKIHRPINDYYEGEEQTAKYMVRKQLDSKIAKILDWETNVRMNNVDEPVVPKNTLFQTYSSRLRALKYRDELLNQMEEKRKRDVEIKQRDRMEDLLLEKRLQHERIKMMQDYEEEQIRLRIRAELLARSEANLAEMDEKETVSSSRASSATVRSPSYHTIRPPKSPINRKVHTFIESKYGHKKSNKSKVTLPIDPGPEKARYDSPKDIIYPSLPKATSQPLYVKSSPIFDDEKLLGDGRVLTRLTETRRLIKERHERMQQQLSQSAYS